MNRPLYRIWDRKTRKYCNDIVIIYNGDNIELYLLKKGNRYCKVDISNYLIESCSGIKDKMGRWIYSCDIIIDHSVNMKGEIYGTYISYESLKRVPLVKGLDIEIIGTVHGKLELTQGQKLDWGKYIIFEEKYKGYKPHVFIDNKTGHQAWYSWDVDMRDYPKTPIIIFEHHMFPPGDWYEPILVFSTINVEFADILINTLYEKSDKGEGNETNL